MKTLRIIGNSLYARILLHCLLVQTSQNSVAYSGMDSLLAENRVCFSESSHSCTIYRQTLADCINRPFQKVAVQLTSDADGNPMSQPDL